jgi:DNA-binding GntR family transcriptional regulator
MEVDRFGPVPAYVQIADWLRSRIASGDIEPGNPVPSKRQLCAQLGVSGGTYDKAIGILKAEGLVRTARGFGHIVQAPDSSDDG